MGNTAVTSTPVDLKIRNEYINVRDIANVLLSFQTIFVFVPLLGMTLIPVGGAYIALISSFLGVWLTWELKKASRTYLVLYPMSVPNQAFIISLVMAPICFICSVLQIIYQQNKYIPCNRYNMRYTGYRSGSFNQYQKLNVTIPEGVRSSSFGYDYCELAPWTVGYGVGVGGIVSILNIFQYVLFCIVIHRLLKVAYQTRTGQLPPAPMLSAGQGQGAAANFFGIRPANQQYGNMPAPVNQPIVVVADPSAPPLVQTAPYNVQNQYVGSSSSAAPNGYQNNNASNYSSYPEKGRPPY